MIGDDLVARDAVVQSALQVKRQLVRAVERDEAGDRHEAAVAWRERRVLPDIAEQHFVGDLSQMRREVAEILAGVGGFMGHGVFS